MFVNTTKICNIILFIDTLISANGIRQRSSLFPIKIDILSPISMGTELSNALKFVTANYRYAVITQQSHEILHMIQNRLSSQFKTGPGFAEDRGFTFSSGVDRQIKKAVESLGFRPCETVFISGDAESIETATLNNLGTICWLGSSQSDSAVAQAGPDFTAHAAQDLQDILTWKKRGYYSEVRASPPDFFIGKPDKPRHQFVRLANTERVGEFIFVGGRYFSTKDTRYQRHALSLRIINSKDHMEYQKSLFSLIMGNIILAVARFANLPPDLLTRVPPKPGQPDRLADQLQAIPGVTKNKISAAQINPPILQCIRSFPSQKGVGYADRRQNVRGVFAASPIVAGKTVYVMDDVVTSGSTLTEACNVLYAAGAKYVIPVAIAYHPKNIYAEAPQMRCKKCGKGTMKARCSKNGSLFYGCSNYYPDKCMTHCDFKGGVTLINQALKINPP